MSFSNRLERLLESLNAENSLSISVHDEFAIIENESGQSLLLLKDETDEGILEQLREFVSSRRSDSPNLEGLRAETLSEEDKAALGFAKDLKREVHIYRNIGAFLIGIIVLALPAIVDWVKTKVVNDMVESSIEWQLEIGGKSKGMERKLVDLEKRLNHLEKIRKFKGEK